MHTSQIITGLSMLRERRVIRLRYERVGDISRYPSGAMVEVEVAGRRVAFDVSDGYNIDLDLLDDYLATCDAWFKRSFSRPAHAALRHADKIHPLGFNYHVMHPAAPRDPVTRLKNFAKTVLPGFSPEWTLYTHDKFEAPPPSHSNGGPTKILFSARLWPPDLDDDMLNLERERINDMRITIVRELRQKYGDLFAGGLHDTPLARELAPEAILPARQTDRVNYLRTVKQCDICIASTGLHRSTGWKMGEYVAASRAIVAERMHYDVPGNYTEGTHYLSFDTPAQCLAHVERLAGDTTRRHAMMHANHAYYRNHLSPDKLVWNALQKVL
jgi:hypothetical protein